MSDQVKKWEFHHPSDRLLRPMIQSIPSLLSSGVVLSGVSGHSFPEGYRLSFPTRTNSMYAVVKHSVPALRALTACLWLRPAEGGVGTPLSYAVSEQPNELVLLQGLHTPAELLVNGKVCVCECVSASVEKPSRNSPVL